MKNIITIILVVIITFSSCYSQTVRIKNLPSSNDSLKANDYLVTDEVSSGEVKKLTVEAIRKGLPAATTNAKGLFSAADKKIISKILYSISGSDTNLIAFGNWDFRGDLRFKISARTNENLRSNEIASDFWEGRPILKLYYDTPQQYTGIDSFVTLGWIKAQNYGTGGSGKVDSTIVPSISNELIAENELASDLIDGFPILKLYYYTPLQYTSIDSFPSLAYINGKLSSYLNPYHFKKFGSPDSVEILDSLFKGTTHGSNLSGVNSEVLYYNTNSVRLNPTSNKQYLSASFVSEKLYAHQVIIYNTSSSHTVTFTPGIAFKLKNNSNVVLGYNDTIVLDYDGSVWRQIGGSDN